ncbi:alpha/beta hydrolase [Arhodomonas aquaeolei]|nr:MULTISPECIES: alpha/beta hydrolase [Arhodomonas]MCS4503149.1 alpha/beta hydrolase [Arhodomonas aquaeolei]
MPYVDTGDARLYFETHGNSGPAVVLIMGLGGTVEAWGMQIPALSRECRVLVMDNRGTGRTQSHTESWTINDMAADVLAAMDAAGIAEAHVVGVSMGGLIAQALYHMAPKRLCSLILGCTGPGVNDPAFARPARAVEEILHIDREAVGHANAVQRLTEVFYHPTYRERVPDLAERLLRFERELDVDPKGPTRQLEAVYSQPGQGDRLADIGIPVLVLHGEDDIVWPMENGEYLAEAIPEARLQLFPETGHMLMLERAREFNRSVLTFIREQE